MKICNKCLIEKEVGQFYRNHDDCKKCWMEYCKIRNQTPEGKEKRRLLVAAWREKNPEKVKEQTKRSLEKNKDKINERRKCPERRKVNNESVKKWRMANPERFKETESIKRKRNRIKVNAVGLVKKHIDGGHLIRPCECEICKKECKPEAHHEDYTKPLEVRWLCRVCHRHQHNKLMDVVP